MIPFDVETAKLALLVGTGRIVTRDGRPVEITGWDDSHEIWPVVGIIVDPYSEESWTREGRWGPNPKTDTKFDLFIEELC